MSSEPQNLRDKIEVGPVVLGILILGSIAVSVSELAPTGALSTMLLAQASYAANSESLDTKCTSVYSYACKYPYYDTKTGEPCGLDRQVISTQVIGHCVAEGRAEVDCAFAEDGSGCKPIQQQVSGSGTQQTGSAAPGAVYNGSFYPITTDVQTLPSMESPNGVSTFGAPSSGQVGPESSLVSPAVEYQQTFAPPASIEAGAQVAAPDQQTGPSASPPAQTQFTSLDNAQVGYMTVGPVPAEAGVNAFGDTQNVNTYDQPARFESASTFQQPNTPYVPSAPDWYQSQWLVNNNITAANQVSNPVTDYSFSGRTDFQNFTSPSLPDWLFTSASYDGASLSNASFVTQDPVQNDFAAISPYSEYSPTFDQNGQLLQAGLNEVANGINMNTYYNSDGIPPELRASPNYQEIVNISSDFGSNQATIQNLQGEWAPPQGLLSAGSSGQADTPLSASWSDFRQSANILDLRNQSAFETQAYDQAFKNGSNQWDNPYTSPGYYWDSFYNRVGVPAESSFTQSLNSIGNWTAGTWSSLGNLFKR